MTRKHSKFTFTLLAIIGVGLLVLFGGSLLWHKQSVTVLNLQNEYRNKFAQLTQINKELEQQETLRSQLTDIEKQLAVLDKDLVNYKFIPSYLKQIQRTALLTGNTLRMIQPEPAAPLNLGNNPVLSGDQPATPVSESSGDDTVTNYQVQRIGLEVSGTYVSLLRFLDALRMFPKMIYVRTINVTPRDQTGNVSARIETYAIIIPDQYKTPADEETPTVEAQP